MTNEELDKALNIINTDYFNDCQKARIEMREKQAKVLNEWANEHARFSIGDYIENSDKSRIIRIEEIYGDYGSKPYIVYNGPLQTKNSQTKREQIVDISQCLMMVE